MFGAGIFIGVIAVIGLAIVTLMALAPETEFVPFGRSDRATTPAEVTSEIALQAVEFAYIPPEVEVTTAVALTLDNVGQVVHNVEIEGITNFKLEAEAGASATLNLGLKPGTYTIFCSIPGHREAGMVGSLTVADG